MAFGDKLRRYDGRRRAASGDAAEHAVGADRDAVNPLMKIADIAVVARIAREANAISVCDDTFTTAILQRPLDWGVDMVWHSTTKYIGGHSDVTGGALITRYDNYLFERARKSLIFGGAAPSPSTAG